MVKNEDTFVRDTTMKINLNLLQMKKIKIILIYKNNKS